MTLPKGITRAALDRENAYFKRRIHRAILEAVTKDGTQAFGSITTVQMMALIYSLIDELIMAAAAANLIGGGQMGTDLVETFGLAVPEGIRVRTLQLRHAVDELSAEGDDGQSRA
jgi:hypothetical protein